MDILDFKGEGYKPLAAYDGWRVAFLRFHQGGDRYAQVERHLLTEEIFVLLEGSAVLYVNDEPYLMEKSKLYNVLRGEWHDIVLSPDATVLIVENDNTSRENSEIMPLEEYRRKYPKA